MRKATVILLILAALLLAALPASADTYKFPQIFMVVDIPLDYTEQLTGDNLEQHREYLASIGETPESMKERFGLSENAFYLSFDHLWFTNHSALELVDDLHDAHARTLVALQHGTLNGRSSTPAR